MIFSDLWNIGGSAAGGSQGCLQRRVSTCQSTLRNIAEERSSHLERVEAETHSRLRNPGTSTEIRIRTRDRNARARQDSVKQKYFRCVEIYPFGWPNAEDAVPWLRYKSWSLRSSHYVQQVFQQRKKRFYVLAQKRGCFLLFKHQAR